MRPSANAVILTLASVIAINAATKTMASPLDAWQVSNVPWGDTLNVRNYPSNKSYKQVAYPNGTILSMTGRCTKNLDLRNLPAWASDWEKRQAVRYRWCEVWHDPSDNGNYVTGWVYGKFISPL